MKVKSFNNELLQASAQFMDVFNDITIDRNNGQSIKVKCLFGQRSRIFKSLENPEKTTIQPPMIIVNRTGLERDSQRVADVNNYLLQMGDEVDINMYPPNPVTITFEVTMVAKYRSDLEKILSNFIPFTNQSLFVKTPNPKVPTEEITHEVIWDGSISEEDTSETPNDQAQLYIATTNFTFHTWIWPGTSAPTSVGIIKKINLQPSLCSLGVQKLFFNNGISTSEEMSALSGFGLDNETYYGDIYGLSHFYAVPQSTSFDDFENTVTLGMIDPVFYDSLPMSGGVSGYVSDLNLGLSIGDAFILSGNEKYYVTNEGGIVIYASTSALSEPFSAVCMPVISGI